MVDAYGQLCDDCLDAGCQKYTVICTYLRENSEPETCDHVFYEFPFQHGPGVYECTRCGKMTEDEDEAFPPVDEEGGDI